MTRFKLWRDWYKHSLNHPAYKFLVLIGLAHSPTFEMHRFTIEQSEKYPSYKFTVKDEKPEKEYAINWGWYIVYLSMIIVNSIMDHMYYDFDIFSWQHQTHLWMLILCFLAGASYRKKL